MTDKQTILVAGATGNIGGGAAVALAKRGARVVVLGRSLERLEARADSIRVTLSEARIECQDTDITTLVVDFSDMEAVRLAAAEALNRFPQIHGLVLSAVALVQHGPSILPSGHELMFATNVMGPFLFTQLLTERMEQSDGLVLHVINPSYKEIDWEDLESIKNHKTETAYERTKTMHRSDRCRVGSTICWKDLLCSIQSYVHHRQKRPRVGEKVANRIPGSLLEDIDNTHGKATCGRG